MWMTSTWHYRAAFSQGNRRAFSVPLYSAVRLERGRDGEEGESKREGGTDREREGEAEGWREIEGMRERERDTEGWKG